MKDARKDHRVYLLHIRDAIRRILTYTAGGRQAFMADSQIQDAVIRNIEIIGEATKNVAQSFRVAHPNVPWKGMAGMRDKVIHDYFGVNLEIVWGAVQDTLPGLQQKIETILQEQEG